ncbi:MAG TPA: hypothetical protein VFZ66_26565 [Herpetosiphonaceae bacterium]
MAQVHHNRLLQAIILLVGMLVIGMALAVAPTGAQEPFTIDVTITDATVNSQTGQVTIQGTVTCSEASSYYVSLRATQYLGRTSTINGYGSTSGTCPGPQGTTFTISLYGTNGRFAPGHVLIEAFASGCAGSSYPSPYPPYPTCDTDQETLTTRLRPSR